MIERARSSRTFKTRWFTKAVCKALIPDDDLCTAVRQAIEGQAVDLGGGVYKKRLDRNRYRSIILAKGERFWVYEYLFAKKDVDNIADDELAAFRKLAAAYAGLNHDQLERLLSNRDLMEICHDDQV